MQIKTYIIGGYVRDLLLETDSEKNDIDFVCNFKCADLIEKLRDKVSPKAEITIFKNFGTAMLAYDQFQLEFVNARKESYAPNSRNPSVSTGTFEDDQKRRDFTINTMAISLNRDNFGALIDPFSGKKDLIEKVIRTPLDPNKTYQDDPLRMFRAIRFATVLNFKISLPSLQAISENRSRIKILSKERITEEFNKILLSDKPSSGLNLLNKTGLLEIILPEVTQLQGVTEIQGQGHKENFWHTLEVVDNVSEKSKNLWLRWAALLHDIGKYYTKRFDEKQGWTFYSHEFVGYKKLPHIFKRLKLPLFKLKYVGKLIRMSARPIPLAQEEGSDSGVRKLIFEAGEDLEDLLILCTSDITTKNKYRRQKYLSNYENLRLKIAEVEEKDRVRTWKSPVDGVKIMEIFKLPPSKEVGILKEKLKNAILDGEIPNEKEAALKFLKSQKEKIF